MTDTVDLDKLLEEVVGPPEDDEVLRLTRLTVQRWRTEGTKPGCGNVEFIRLGRDLAILGLKDTAIVAVLLREANRANSPSQRRRQIYWIMRTIRRYRREGRSLQSLCPYRWQKRNLSTKGKK